MLAEASHLKVVTVHTKKCNLFKDDFDCAVEEYKLNHGDLIYNYYDSSVYMVDINKKEFVLIIKEEKITISITDIICVVGLHNYNNTYYDAKIIYRDDNNIKTINIYEGLPILLHTLKDGDIKGSFIKCSVNSFCELTSISLYHEDTNITEYIKVEDLIQTESIEITLTSKTE